MPAEVGSGGVGGCDHAGPGVGRSLLDEIGSQKLGQGEGPETVADVFYDLLAQEGSQDSATPVPTRATFLWVSAERGLAGSMLAAARAVPEWMRKLRLPPRVHAKTPEGRTRFWVNLREFLDSYRQAAEDLKKSVKKDLKKGIEDVCFPEGSFPPGMPLVELGTASA